MPRAHGAIHRLVHARAVLEAVQKLEPRLPRRCTLSQFALGVDLTRAERGICDLAAQQLEENAASG